MGRSRALDWLLLATLLPAYLVIQGVAVHGALTHGLWRYPFEITGAQGPAGYPVVNDGWDQPFRVGDRVLRFGDVDLQGLSLADVWNAMASALNDGRPYQVEVERGGGRLELTVTPTLYP